jgi:hypothetical protein
MRRLVFITLVVIAPGVGGAQTTTDSAPFSRTPWGARIFKEYGPACRKPVRHLSDR